MNPRHELVLEDSVWKAIVEKSRSPHTPKRTLLCPECIEALYGGVVPLHSLILKWRTGGGTMAAVPINKWYMKEHGMMEEAKPYIDAYCKMFGEETWKKL